MPKPAAVRTELVRSKIKNSNSIQYLIILAVIIVIVVVALLASGDKSKSKTISKTPTSACGPYRDDLSVVISGQKFHTELTKSSAESQKGLGGRPCIKPDQAMLFAFAKSGQYRFWMKDMKFPIDILWISSSHKVAAIEIDVEPSTYHSSNPFFENDPNHLAKYVLEIKANRTKELHIGLGTPVNF